MGLRRSMLQDAYLVAEALGVVAIADGMGGKWHGELAAKAALQDVERAMASETTQRIARYYTQSPDLAARRHVLARLHRVVVRAHECVRKLGQAQDPPCELGTTPRRGLVTSGRSVLSSRWRCSDLRRQGERSVTSHRRSYRIRYTKAHDQTG